MVHIQSKVTNKKHERYVMLARRLNKTLEELIEDALDFYVPIQEGLIQRKEEDNN